VGKTTTIAKIASLFSLNYGKDVALITSDTYRIAAVEQLRTYANILGIPIKVVYSREEMMEAIDFFSDKELVLIDTAGRSYKNQEHQQELKELLEAVSDKEVFLALSVATKYKDMLKMVNIYKAMTEFRVIFTKLDETVSYGNIFNIRKATGVRLSYITFGQNVPDDISEINPHEIAKSLLGGGTFGSSN
jgi:flagellar biosynthesis protein FlhF